MTASTELDLPTGRSLHTYRSVGIACSHGRPIQVSGPGALMTTRTPDDAKQRHREILETAARLICARGYEATSIQDIADACGLTKAGLYHHIESKEHLLLEIMNYGMDVFEEQVLSQVESIADPVERLRMCMEKNILLVTRGWSKEVTIILHEHATLQGRARNQIDARKKKYVRFLEKTIGEAVKAGKARPVNTTVATFAFLGMVLWIYKWYRKDGAVPDTAIARGMVDLFLHGLVPVEAR